MGFWRQVFGLEQRAPLIGPADLFRQFFAAPPVKSGVAVNWQSAMLVMTVLACVRVIAEDVAGLPRGVYRRLGSSRVALPTDPLQQVLDYPNDWQTAEEFVEMLTLHAALTGNGLAIKNIVNGQVRELLPLQPGWVTRKQNKDWSITYTVRLPDGGAPQVYASGQVVHLRGPSWDGVSGLDVVAQAREAIGLATALEESHALLHKNGVEPSGVYSVDGPLDGAQYERLRVAVEQQISGSARHKALILDRGGKFTPISMSGVDAQHIETRKHQIEEVCRAFRVFPQMIGHTDKTATFASAEQFFIAHVKYTLLPWVRRWEGSIRRDLIGRDGVIAGKYVKHNVAALERADINTRYMAYQLGISGGWMLRADARELEDLDPVPGLDKPTLPLNTSILDENGLPIPASVTPHSEPPGDPNAPPAGQD